MKKQKILILANNSGGLYDFRQDLIQALMADHEVVLATPFDLKIDELKEIGCRVIETPMDRRGINPVKDLSLFLRYTKLLLAEKPDMLMTYTIKPGIYGGTLARLFHIKYAANITGLGTAFEKQGVLQRLIVGMYKFALKKARVVFFENSANKQVFVDKSIIKESQTCVLNGAGVNLDKFSVQPYPEDDGEIRFIYMGRIMAEKGINELFDTMRRLKGESVNCRLDMIGYFDEDFEEKIKTAEADGWLKYHGYQSDVRPFIKNCHCFVLPSWHEGMANTNLECAASGRPVITSNIHGCLEAVEDGVTGFLCEKKDSDDLYRVMKRFCGLPYEKRMVMGLAGRKRMEEIFDKRKVVEETIKCLQVK